MNNSQATPDKDKLSIWSKTSQIEIGTYKSTSMKLEIVNLNRQKKMRSPQHSRGVSIRTDRTLNVLMNRMTPFNGISLPMISRAIK